MKKLMIAAFAAALTGAAVAENCGPDPKPCAFGYQVKIYLKTTGAASTASNTVTCVDGACVRVPAVKRMAGFLYGFTSTESTGACGDTGCACNDWDTTELLLWDYDTKREAMPKTATIDVMDRIFTGDTSTVELAFTLDDMKYAGFGRAAKRNGQWTLKWATGFGAGTLAAPACTTCTTSCGVTECAESGKALAWDVCDKETAAPTYNNGKTAAYGKWTIDWSATVFNRVTNGLTLIPGASWEAIEPVELKR